MKNVSKQCRLRHFDIHSILRAQESKPVEIDQFTDSSPFWEVWFLLCIWAWGIGHTYGEVIICWLRLLSSE